MEGQEHIEQHGNDHDHEEKTRAASRVKASASAGGGQVQLTASFESPHHFVFSAVILENPLDLLRLRDQHKEAEEQCDANDTVYKVEDQKVSDDCVMNLEPRGQIKRQELVEGDKEDQREKNV